MEGRADTGGQPKVPAQPPAGLPPSDDRQRIGETCPETLDPGRRSITIKLREPLYERLDQAIRWNCLHVQVRGPVTVAGWAADLGENRPARKAGPRRHASTLQVSEDEHWIVGRLAAQLEENALPPAAVTVKVMIDQKYRCGLRCGHMGTPRYMEVDPKVHPVAGPFEIAPLPDVTPVLEIASVRPLDPMARMEIVHKGLSGRRIEQRINPTCEPFRVLRTPAHSLFVEVYSAE